MTTKNRGRLRPIPARPYVGGAGPEPREPTSESFEVRRTGDPFGAPHFPPSENLPPQAKRLAAKKRQVAAAKGELPEEEYPDALPRTEDLAAAWGEVLEHLDQTAGPVLRSAAESWRDLVQATRELLRVPGQLVRAFVPQRQAG